MAYNYEYPYVDANQANADWLINEMKRLAEEWVKVQGEWNTEQEAFENLKKYINEYFDNLDVQDEINNKLEEMHQNGELAAIIIPTIIKSYIPVIVNSVDAMINTSVLYVLKSNGHVYQYTNNNWVDTMIVYGDNTLNAWEYMGIIQNNSDYNNFLPYTIYYQTGNYANVTHAPFDLIGNVSGFVLTYGVNNPATSSYTSSLQVYVSLQTGEFLASRRISSDTWNRVGDFYKSGMRYMGFSTISYDNMLPYTIYYQSSDYSNYPTKLKELIGERPGWVYTLGVNSNSNPSRYLQEYYDLYTGEKLAYRRTNTDVWNKVQMSEHGNTYATIVQYGNSILRGEVVASNSATTIAPYGSSPWSVIGEALNIKKGNNTFIYTGGTGLLEGPHDTNFYTQIINNTSINDNDVVLTHMWRGDMSYQIGDSSSSVNTLCGAVVDIINRLTDTQFVLVSIPPTMNYVNQSRENFYSYVWPNGNTIKELDTKMKELSKELHFIYVSWEDFNLTYKMPDFEVSDNIHLNNNKTYRLLGAFVGAQISKSLHF